MKVYSSLCASRGRASLGVPVGLTAGNGDSFKELTYFI